MSDHFSFETDAREIEMHEPAESAAGSTKVVVTNQQMETAFKHWNAGLGGCFRLPPFQKRSVAAHIRLTFGPHHSCRCGTTQVKPSAAEKKLPRSDLRPSLPSPTDDQLLEPPRAKNPAQQPPVRGQRRWNGISDTRFQDGFQWQSPGKSITIQIPPVRSICCRSATRPPDPLLGRQWISITRISNRRYCCTASSAKPLGPLQPGGSRLQAKLPLQS